ncbi:MAG: efflux RND transporter periplasmic adaptor subunit [Planctomycetota bacterium]|nr:efflux RND transporter periplasmic adaptor subunit [Planctomycetota bacterium]
MIRLTTIAYAVVATLVAPVAVQAAGGLDAVTRPYQDVTLSFTVPGMIAELCVGDGKAVAKGKELVKLDSGVDRAGLAVLEATREANKARIEARVAQRDEAVVKLDKTKVAFKGGGATDLQVKEAELEVRIADIQLKLENLDQEKNEKEIAKAHQELKRMTLLSPIDGRVEESFAKEGESVDRLMKVVRVVNVEKFHVEVLAPLGIARTLTVDEGGRQSAVVVFPGPDGLRVPGTIQHVRLETNAGTDKIGVRVEVPNPGGRKAGEHVRVEFPSLEDKDSAAGPGEPSATTTGQNNEPGKGDR